MNLAAFFFSWDFQLFFSFLLFYIFNGPCGFVVVYFYFILFYCFSSSGVQLEMGWGSGVWLWSRIGNLVGVTE